MSAENRLTSIVSYPERGTGGNNRYRGNCSPKLIEDLIGFFRPAEICDYMCGSGTTQDAAHTMGIISHCYDLHSGFDLINCEIPERPEFVFWHPPYWDMITYSDVMYKASEVQSKYGYDPRQFDLSRIPVPFPVSWTVKMKKKQKETQDILSYHTQAAGCSDKARAKASGGRQPIEECGRTGL